MRFYRLVKPLWGQPKLGNGEANPKFVEPVEGPNIYEGCNFTPEFLKEANQKGYNIYWFPNHPSGDVYKTGTKFLSGKNIDVFDYVYVDMDLKDKIYKDKAEFLDRLKEFPMKPSLVVDSGNGVHAYWSVEDLTRDTYCLIQMALLNHLKTDESVWTVLQLMRVPNFHNTKRHKDYVKAQVVSDMSSGSSYTLSDFPKTLFSELSEEQRFKVKRHLDRLDGKEDLQFAQDRDRDALPEKFIKDMEKNPKLRELFEDPKSFGDRSAADMKLTNYLFSKKYDINDALSIISNTQKALEKGSSRLDYAKVTVGKVFTDRPTHKFETASAYLSSVKDQIVEKQVKGPYYLDTGVLGEPWRRKEMLGLIAGSGVGKTAIVLNIIADIIKNNPENDDVFLFFSLEMTKGQVIQRWVNLVGEGSSLTDRLYVIDKQDSDGMPSLLGLQEIYEYCTQLKQVTGKEIGTLVIDHFHIIDKHIDTRKQPNFGIESEQNAGYGSVKTLSANEVATQLKALTKSLNTFSIVLAQTTKEKGIGDTPIGKDGAYGVSQFEWIVDRIITAWQPLMRVQDLTDHRFLAFQYAKIRELRTADKIKPFQPKLLTFNLDSGKLMPTTEREYEVFRNLLPKASEARRAAKEQKEPNSYSLQLDLGELHVVMEKLGVNL